MGRKKPGSCRKAVLIGLMAVLLAACGFLAARVIRLSGEVSVEAARTPTPEPPWGNVMQVTPDPDQPMPAPVLRVGSKGDAVKELQARLQTLGYDPGEIDGQYGNGTRNAVRLFQQVNGLEADGIFGTESSDVLYSAAALPCPATATPAPTAEPTAAPTPSPAPEARLPGFDDEGLPLLINASHPLPEDYRTAELVNLSRYCDQALVRIKANGIEGEKTAVDALQEMLRAAVADGVSNWQVSAGYRSVGYQQTLLDRKTAEYVKQGFSRSRARSAALKTVAEPGTSEHHTGLAFDITVPGTSFNGTKQQKWLAEHCWEHGFIIRYTKDKEAITGILAEPWHIRWVGTEHALRIRAESLCLEEYVEKYAPAAE